MRQHQKHHTVKNTKEALLEENSSLRAQIERLRSQISKPIVDERNLTDLFETMPEGIFLLDDAWHLVYMNKSAEELWGKRKDRLLGKVLWNEFPSGVDTRPYRELLRAALEQTPVMFETKSPVGQDWLEVDAYPHNQFMLVVHHIITKQKELEQALRAKEKRYRELFENAPIGIYRTTPDGHILMVNPALLSMLGYESFEELARLNLENEGYPSSYSRQEFKKRIESEGEVKGAEAAWMKRDGSVVYVRENAKVIRNSAGESLYYEGTVEDITQRKQFEDELRQINQELEIRVEERTQQLRATIDELESFSYSVSHDLRAPLRAIHSFTSIVLSDSGKNLPEESQRHLQIVIDNVQVLGRLVDDLLAFTHLGKKALELAPVNMDKIVRDVIEKLRRMEPAGREIEVMVHSLGVTRGSAPLLQIVWTNLLSNAMKFTRNTSPSIIEVGCIRRQGESVFFVRDNGPGFDQEYAHKVFEVFERLHRSDEYEGTGIGLALVKRIVERHRGRVWAESKPRQGATFYFTLQD